mgnify:FL=1
MDKPDKLEVLSGELQNTIQQCLRKGDSFTKYSPSQFLILLVGTNKENCSMISTESRDTSPESIKLEAVPGLLRVSVAEVDRQRFTDSVQY